MGLLVSDNYWVDTIVLVLTVLYLIYWYATSTFDYWAKQGVREVKTKEPFFGAIRKSLFLQRQISLHYHDMYKELEGEKYGGLFNMRTPALMVRDPELLKYILVKDFSSFTDNTSHVNGDNDPMFGRYNFSAQPNLTDSHFKILKAKKKIAIFLISPFKIEDFIGP